MVQLPSGLTLPSNAHEMLTNFCREEFAYYDGVDSSDPYEITPVDVLVTNSVNSFVNSATKIRRVHRALSATCDPLLRDIRPDASLLDEAWPEKPLARLLSEACLLRDVLMPVATKVLHRKRRNLIPMIDSVLIDYYLGPKAVARAQNKKWAAEVGMSAINGFRQDLTACGDEIRAIQASLSQDGYQLSEVRVFEILVWINTEPAGYYRNLGSERTAQTP